MTKGQLDPGQDVIQSPEPKALPVLPVKVFDRNAAVKALLKPKCNNKNSPKTTFTPTQRTQEYTFKCRTGNIHRDFREQLNFMRKQSNLCDLTVSCNGNLLTVHRLILIVGCPYFRDRLKDLNEEEVTLSLKNTDSDILGTLLDFMYTGNFKALKYLEVNKLQEVNALAKSLGLKQVDVCKESVLRQCLATKNFIHMWNLADTLLNTSIRKEVVAYIMDNLDSLWITTDLMTLGEDRMRYLLTAIYDNEDVQQNVVLRMLVAWLKHDLDSRKPMADGLIPFVRMTEVSEAYARYLLQYEPFVQDCPVFKEQLSRNIVYHSLHQNVPQTKRSNRSNGTGAIVIVDCHDGLTSAAWSKRKSSIAICDSSVAKFGLNGYRKCPIKKKVAIEVLSDRADEEKNSDTKEQLVEKNHPLLTSKSLPSSAKSSRLEAEIFIPKLNLSFKSTELMIIGHNPANSLLSYITYNVKSCAWEDACELGVVSTPKERILVHNTDVCIVGGEEDGRKNKVRSVYVTDISTKIVRRLPDLHIPRSSPCLFMLNSVLYVAGGEGRYTDALSQVEYIDINDQLPMWRNWPPMRNKRHGNAMACYIQGKVVVIGGGTHKCECIQPDHREWRPLAPLPEEFAQMTPHMVPLHGTAVAFNYYRPSKLFTLDTTNHCWQQDVIKGKPPDWVLSATSLDENVYALDKSLKIFKLESSAKKWVVETKLPRINLQPAVLSMCGDFRK